MPTGCNEVKRFFDELAPRLETARILDRELDRELAHRFNVFDYLRTNELGLSRVIADLLDPGARHGQGVLFLRIYLEKLEGFRETLRWPDLHGTSVRCEEKITEGRIDVVVRIKGPGGETHCLVLENKPYAYDQESQVERYLEHFGKDDRFLLIYLSPTGEGPSEVSVPKDKLREWRDHFAIMPYVGAQEEQGDGFDEYRLSHSLANWLGECRKDCEVDRLRWFLADMERFCQGRFGGQAMTTDGEGKTVQEFVLEDPTRIETAAAVYESWLDIRDGVCREFLEGLESRIREAVGRSDVLVGIAADIKPGQYYIKMYRKCWTRQTDSDRTTEIMLVTDKRAPKDWYFAVWSPERKEERGALETRLESRLATGRSTRYLAWWEWVEKYGNWDSLVPALHKENQERGGDITSYFVNRFIEIAKVAVPIIDEFEDSKA